MRLSGDLPQESLFAELKRYVRFTDEDGAVLRAFLPAACPHFRAIVETFYQRLQEHDDARRVLDGPAQVARLQGMLERWLEELLSGPWDEAYGERRARIGRMHVRVGLPQRFMFSAMNLIRGALDAILTAAGAEPRAHRALDKIIDVELGVMLETYREAYVEQIFHLERQRRAGLENELALSEARFEEIVEKGGCLVTTFDADGVVLFFNRLCEALTGLHRSQAVGRYWHEIFVAPEGRAEVLKRARGVLAGTPAPPFELATPNGRRLRWYLTTLPTGAELILCGIGADVTEERALEVRARRAEQLANLGTMAAGLAHEIRNPINAATLQLAVAARRLAPVASEVPGALEATRLASGEMSRVAHLVEEFLQFARPTPLRVREADLARTAADLVELVRPEADAAGVSLALESAEACPCRVDDERVRQVLLNLMRNAMEATGAGGHVVVRVAPREDSVHVEVADDGPGVPSGAPIFEPFFTTKDAGTGLGLSIVHRIVTDHGGQLDADSRPGRTVFTVRLPR